MPFKKHCFLLFLLVFITLLNTIATCPSYCQCRFNFGMKYVTCVGQTLVSVDLDVPISVQWLQLSNNSISELKNNIFWDLRLSAIVRLDLDHNQIQQIGLNAFFGMNRLRKVDLSYNHLYYILPHTFEMNTQLEELSISGNPIRHLPAVDPFLVSSSLVSLDLSNCRFTYLRPNTFMSLPQLKSLNISHTGISQVTDVVLTSMENLKEMDVTGSGMKCNSNVDNLSKWGASRSVHIIGFPCLNSQSFSKKTPIQKSEKMIFIEGPHTYVDDVMDYEHPTPEDNCSCDCPALIEEATSTTEKAAVRNKMFFDWDWEWIIFFAFVDGVVVGGALTTAILLTWIYCCKARFNRRQRRLRLRNQFGSYEAPPPAYSELF